MGCISAGVMGGNDANVSDLYSAKLLLLLLLLVLVMPGGVGGQFPTF